MHEHNNAINDFVWSITLSICVKFGDNNTCVDKERKKEKKNITTTAIITAATNKRTLLYIFECSLHTKSVYARFYVCGSFTK